MKKHEVQLRISMECCYAQGVKCKKKQSNNSNHVVCSMPYKG